MSALTTRRAVVAGAAAIGLSAPALATVAVAVADPVVALVEERRTCLLGGSLDRIAAIDAELVLLEPTSRPGAVALLELIEDEISCNAVEGDFIPTLLTNARTYLGKEA